MSPLIVQEHALDDAFVAPDDRAIIGKCNLRMEPIKPQKEATFKLDNKIFNFRVEVFLEVLQICPRLPKCRLAPPFKSSNPLGVKEKTIGSISETQRCPSLAGKKHEAADLKKAIRASKLVSVPSHAACSSKGVGLKPEVLNESKVGIGTDDDSTDSWGTKSDEEVNDIPWETESENGYHIMEAAKKHDDDKAKEEKDTIHEPVQIKQAEDDQEEFLAPKIHKERPILLVSTSSHSVSSNYSNLVSSLERSLRETGKESTDSRELKQAYHSPALLASMKSKIPSAVNNYRGSKLGDSLQQSVADIRKIKIEHAEKQDKTQHPSKSFDEASLAEDEDPPARPDQGLKKRKTSKDAEQSKKPKLTGSSKGTTSSQPKSTSNFVQSEETVFEAEDTKVPIDQGDDLSNTTEQPNTEAPPKHDWFIKPARPPTPDPEWKIGKSVDNEPELPHPRRGLDRIRARGHDVIIYITQDQGNDH
nr:hypothetical protein [Tanacetum cinerariifolium]